MESLDYLRGVLALGVMVYHYKMWNGITCGYPFEQFFQRIGIYAVCTFYVLSGMSLGIVYRKRQLDTSFLVEFGVKRLFRIVPLFWAVTTLTIILRWYLSPALGMTPVGLPPHPALLALLNYSLGFGWIRPDLYIAAGSWSIGNELVFYSLFPGLLLLMRASRISLAATVSIAVAISLAFARLTIARTASLEGHQWEMYVNPLNHLFLFAAGVALAIGCSEESKPSSAWLLSALVICVAVFWLWPTAGRGGTILVTGVERVLFSGLCCAFCYLALKWHRGFGRFSGVLVWIGNISYAVYLLHPLLLNLVDILNAKVLHANVLFVSCCLAMPATILCAVASWRFLEKPCMRLGRRLLPKLPLSASGSGPSGALAADLPRRQEVYPCHPLGRP